MSESVAPFGDSFPHTCEGCGKVAFLPVRETKQHVAFDVEAFTQDLREMACARMGITVAELTGKSHKREHVNGRHAVTYILRGMGLSFPVIGRLVNRDHTTAMNGYQRADALYEHDKHFRAAVEGVRHDLDARGWQIGDA